jgi:hypothetical protein
MSVKVPTYYGDIAYLGSSKAIVIDNKDPNQAGRVRVYSSVYGESPWIHCLTIDDGFFAPPDIGTVVYIEADGGDPDFIIVTGIVNDGDPLNPDTPTSFRRSVPTNRGWVTPGTLDATGRYITQNAGHRIELDDGIALDSNGVITHTKESRGIRLTTSSGHYLHLLEEETDGTQQNHIALGTLDGQSVQLIDDNDQLKQQVIIKDKEERTIEIIKATDRIRIRNKTGTIYIDIDFTNDTITVDAEHVKLGTNAAQSIVRGDAFKTLFESHTHPYVKPLHPDPAPADTDPPNQTLSSGVELSDKHKVE